MEARSLCVASSSIALHLIWNKSLSLSLLFTDLARLTSHHTLEIFPSLPPQYWDYWSMPPCLAWSVDSGDWDQLFMLSQLLFWQPSTHFLVVIFLALIYTNFLSLFRFESIWDNFDYSFAPQSALSSTHFSPTPSPPLFPPCLSHTDCSSPPSAHSPSHFYLMFRWLFSLHTVRMRCTGRFYSSPWFKEVTGLLPNSAINCLDRNMSRGLCSF